MSSSIVVYKADSHIDKLVNPKKEKQLKDAHELGDSAMVSEALPPTCTPTISQGVLQPTVVSIN